MNGFNAYSVNLADTSTDVLYAIKKGRSTATEAVKSQIASMEQWCLMCDLRSSYITMQPAYEANLIEKFAELQSKNLIKWAQQVVLYDLTT